MKAKPNSRTTDGEPASLPAGEEFFRLPRAEFLVEEIQQDPGRHIGDLVNNSPHRLSHRFTMKAADNGMQGADIRAGDHLVVEKKNRYAEGTILAIRLGTRQLVRRYFHTGGRIHLQCDPPSKQIIIVEEHTPDFKILGQVIQIIREIR